MNNANLVPTSRIIKHFCMNYQNKELPFYLVPPEVFVCFKLGLCNTRLERAEILYFKSFYQIQKESLGGEN